MKTGLVIFALVVITFFVLPNLMMTSAATDISQNDFINNYKSRKKFVLLDVRTQQEFNQGHIKGAININHSDVGSQLGLIPKDKDIILYCRTGRRVAIAANTLAKNGYENLYHLKGDITAWVRSNRPLTKK